MALKISEQVANLENEVATLKERLKTERALGKTDALKYLSYKTKGFSDGTAAILIEHGVDGAESFALADRIWDMVKDLSSKT